MAQYLYCTFILCINLKERTCQLDLLCTSAINCILLVKINIIMNVLGEAHTVSRPASLVGQENI